MKNILLFEAFASNKIKSLLKYLNKEESKRIIDDLRSIMVEYDYPISTINDIHISYNKTNRSLDIIPESGFYIKYFYDRNGDFITKTTTRPEKVNLTIKKIKELQKPYEVEFSEAGYSNFFSCKINSKVEDYLKWFKTGDKVYAVLGNTDEIIDGDIEIDVIFSTIYVDSNNEMYLIQNERDGSYPDEDFSRFGNYSWVICRSNKVCDDHLIVAVNNNDLDNKPLQFSPSQIEINEYNFNSKEQSSDYLDILDKSDFAVTIKVGDILNTEFKKLSDIKRHREERKS